jgi:hypothetical protein
MPATLLGLAGASRLPSDYRNAVRNASLVRYQGCEELHVPIAAALALEILKGESVRIGSILVTMDGRWWESEKLQSGDPYVVVYKPGARMRIDYSADHAKLVAPWPETEIRWSGAVHFRDSFEIFGREWRVASWETDGERTLFHLEFSRALKAEVSAAADRCLRRSLPASVDMAWTALENALVASLIQKSSQPIEQLRHSDLIPLGRAIFALAESVKHRRLPKRETIATHLRAICYFQAEISLSHGRVPWRILPASLREAFLGRRLDPALLDLLKEVFNQLPQALSGAISQSPASRQSDSTSPSQAA